MQKIILIFCFIFLLLVCFIFATRTYRKWNTSIKGTKGIEESIFVEIGGIDQFLQIRGEDQDNPIILFLHGGPGFPISYLSYVYQGNLEDKYTVVQWDQRNAGRTYYKNTGVDIELSAEIMLSDSDEVVDYLCQRFDKDQIIIMGQSWGTVLGVQYVQMHPEKVQAYIGVGQVVDFDEGKIFAAEEGLKIAEIKKDKKNAEILSSYIEEFRAIESVSDMNIKHLVTMISTSINYLKGEREISAWSQIWNGVLSPSMSFYDLKWYLTAINTAKLFSLEEELIDYMYFQFDMNEVEKVYEVPMYFIVGGNDYITPHTFVKDIYDEISAPEKKLIIIEGTGHTPFLDQPEEFANHVIELLEKKE